MKAISKTNGRYNLTISAARLISDSRERTGYRAEELGDQNFLIAPNATITLQRDPLTQLIDRGVIVDKNYELPSHRIQTVPLIELIEKSGASSFNLTEEITAPFHFICEDGVMVHMEQQYVP